ncbi:MAG: hypothetical protein AB7H96_19955 [Vicinamibacterales bacterium]
MSHSSHSHVPQQTSGVQEDHIDLKGIFGFGIGLTVVTIIAHVLMLWMYKAEIASVDASNPPRVYPLATDQDERRPPEPRLQGGVKTDNSGRLQPDAAVTDRNLGVRDALKSLRDEEADILSGYRWVDRNGQIVRIPIADAMKLTLQQGLPYRQAAAAAPAETPAAATETEKK